MKKIIFSLFIILLFAVSCSYFQKEKEDNTLRNLGILALIAGRGTSSASCSGDSGMVICIPKGIAE